MMCFSRWSDERSRAGGLETARPMGWCCRGFGPPRGPPGCRVRVDRIPRRALHFEAPAAGRRDGAGAAGGCMDPPATRRAELTAPRSSLARRSCV